MQLRYYPGTNSLYVELKATPGAETLEVADGLNVDLDDKGEIVGFDISPRSRAKLCRFVPTRQNEPCRHPSISNPGTHHEEDHGQRPRSVFG